MKRTKMTKWLVLILGLSSPLGLQAQSFLGTPWSQGSPAVTTGTDTNGTFVSTAPLYPFVITFNATESSTSNPQLLWVPGLSAFRVGSFSTAASATSLGQYSVAMGRNTTASGQYAMATGYSSSASALNSTVIGTYTIASGLSSTALGSSTTAIGNFSVAIGCFSTASGSYSIALGGPQLTASGSNSAAFGTGTVASGNVSTGFGAFTTANSYNGFVIGRYNLGKSASNGTPSATAWVAEDPLLEIGNGTSSSAPSNALVVYKNGQIRIPTVQGDISMGEFAP